MKKYYYNWKRLLLTFLLYPIIFFKSKKVFNDYKIFCWEWEKTGLDQNGIERNSFASYEQNLKEWNLPKTKFSPEMIKEYDLTTPKGNISCLKITHPDSQKWVIGLHGWTGDKYSALRLVEHFYHAGYNVLVFDSFAHGKTYGQKTDIGYSAIEIIDTIIEDLKKNYEVSSLGLIGNSMGAATAVFYSQTGKLKNELNWVIEDCGFFNLKILYRYYLENNWSHQQWWLVANGVIKRFTKETGVDHSKYDLLVHMQDNANTPVYFMHAQGDTWIPYWMSQEMFRLKQQYETNVQSEAWFPTGSSHVHIIEDYYDEYVANTLAFAAKNDERKNQWEN